MHFAQFLVVSEILCPICCVISYIMSWCSEVLCNMWCGVMWCGVVWWCGMWCGVVWYGAVPYGTLSHERYFHPDDVSKTRNIVKSFSSTFILQSTMM